jgi:rhomboid family GlyGly-CTERM serine protease
LVASLREILWRCELGTLALLLSLFNLPLLAGQFSPQFIFHPAAVRAGEWWRVLTHPFVHVSWYHLALDAAAFFLAYAELRDRRCFERFAFVVAAGAGSLLAAVLASPLIAAHGLCGLSGIAHGLTALVGLELVRQHEDKLQRFAGLVCFLSVVGKSILEAATGDVLFARLHFGWLGTPIAVCHAGGVLGALGAWLGLGLRYPHAASHTLGERRS